MDRFHSIYFIGRKTSKRIFVVREEINEKTAYIQARSFMARTLAQNGKECQAEGEVKRGHMKSFTSTTHENCQGSISSTLRTRNSKKPSRMLARNWKHQLLPLRPATLLRTIRIVGMVHPIKLKQNLRVFGS